MKKNILFIAIAVAAVAMGSCSCQKSNTTNRDYAYEAYCDSIWEADKDYYMDVLCETDEYCTYLEEHGSWWGE